MTRRQLGAAFMGRTLQLRVEIRRGFDYATQVTG